MNHHNNYKNNHNNAKNNGVNKNNLNNNMKHKNFNNNNNNKQNNNNKIINSSPSQNEPQSNNKYNIVSQLQNYMFTKETFDKHFVKFEDNNNNINKNKQPKDTNKNAHRKNHTETPQKTASNFFYPKQKDSLFWCFYIIKNGFTPYEMEPANFVKEKSEKIKYIDMLRNDKTKLKEHKIKPISEIEDYLANKEQIDLKTFIALCILENINIIIINKKTIFEIKTNETINVHVVHQQDFFRFNIELNITEEGLSNYRNNYFQIHQIDKPLLSVSSYKLSELDDFCKKLLITQESFDLLKQKRTKQNMYDLIVSTLNKN